jgi:hypothetical protein
MFLVKGKLDWAKPNLYLCHHRCHSRAGGNPFVAGLFYMQKFWRSDSQTIPVVMVMTFPDAIVLLRMDSRLRGNDRGSG